MAAALTAAPGHPPSETASTAPTSQLLTVAEFPVKGRTLVSSQPLKAGQVVLRDSPILVYSAFPLTHSDPSLSRLDGVTAGYGDKNYCSHCFRNLQSFLAASLVPCSSCPDAMFCSPKCHSAALHSASHGPFLCQALMQLRNCPSVQELDQEHQAQVRFLVSAYNLAVVSPSEFQVLLSLHGSAGRVDDAAATKLLHSLMESLSLPLSHSVPGFSVELTEALLVKDRFNAFSLMEPFSPDGERSVRAYGIYPGASFFNHDCLPNACRFDYLDVATDRNTDLIVRMIHDVPGGREICLSYFPVNETYCERQKRLREDFGFTCECDRCKIEANWSDCDDGDDMMEEDSEEPVVDSFENSIREEDDFPHAYFFMKFMCGRRNCWGTLAPLPPSDDGMRSNIMECSACGGMKEDENGMGDS